MARGLKFEFVMPRPAPPTKASKQVWRHRPSGWPRLRGRAGRRSASSAGAGKAPPAALRARSGSTVTRARARRAPRARMREQPVAGQGRGHGEPALRGQLPWASSTSWVCVTTAHSPPSALWMVVCHTWVLRPRRSGTSHAHHRALGRAGDEMGAGVRGHGLLAGPGFSTVPTAPGVSANAMYEPPCGTCPAVHRSARTVSSARTRSAWPRSGARPAGRAAWVE